MKDFMPLARQYERQDPEDLAQELAIFAWKLRRSGENPRYFKKKLAWFSMDYRRKRYKEREREPYIEDIPFEAQQQGGGFVSIGVLPLLARGIPSEQGKEVLSLVVQGYTHREIAKKLRISKSQAGRTVQMVRGVAKEYVF